MSMKKRMSSEESRALALETARRLLLSEDRQAVTLKAVASRLGRTHANLLHHFGSANGLHDELAGYIADQLCLSLKREVKAIGNPQPTRRELVDALFRVIDRDAGGSVVNWLLSTGHEESIVKVARQFDELYRQHFPVTGSKSQLGDVSRKGFGIMLVVLGNALLGSSLADAFAANPDAARQMAGNLVEEAA